MMSNMCCPIWCLATIAPCSWFTSARRLKVSRVQVATHKYTFTDDKPSDTEWVIDILRKFEAIDTSIEQRFLNIQEDSAFEITGDRTFVLTVGGIGSGKTWAMEKLSMGTSKDFVKVDPDQIRENSPAYREVLRVASENNDIPRALMSDPDVHFNHLGEILEKGTSWLDLSRIYLFGGGSSAAKKRMPTRSHAAIFNHVFDPDGKASVIYDSTCRIYSFCVGLIDKAKAAGFKRIVILNVNIDVQCAIHRAGESRAMEIGRSVPDDTVRASHAAAAKNAPLLLEHAQNLFPDAWTCVTSDPWGSLDRHTKCPTDIAFTLSGQPLPIGFVLPPRADADTRSWGPALVVVVSAVGSAVAIGAAVYQVFLQ